MSRVCIVTPDLAGPTRNGGIGTHCLYLARFLARGGDDVTLVHTGPPDVADRARWKETFVREHGARLLFLDDLPDEPAVPVLPHTDFHRTAHRVYRWLRGQDFQTIHFQDWQGNGAICARAKQTGLAFAHTRLVVTAHGPSEWIRAGMQQFPTEGRTTLINDVLERTAIALADTVICPTKHLRDWLARQGWALPADVRIAPLLFEAPAGAAAPRSLHAGELAEIVFFGRLETRKGLEPFLEALERIASRDPVGNGRRLRVTFVGKPHTTMAGPALAAIEKTAKTCAPQMDFSVHDTWNHEQAIAWLATRPQALVVTPSLADNSPFTVIECLTLGQPLLAAQRGGIPELIASPAHLVEPTSEALGDRLEKILREGLPAYVPAWTADAAIAAWTKIAGESPPAFIEPTSLPRISVCVPHFNHPAELAATLAALAEQTFAPHEVIVADDGSDSTHDAAWAELCARHAAPHWHFLKLPHGGPAAARNAAAGRAAGDALVFCDADNRPERDMLAHLGRALVASGADIVTCAFTAHRPDANGRLSTEVDYLFAPLGGAIELAVIENFIGDTNFIIRREHFQRAGGFDAANRAASEDWQFLLRAILEGRTIAVLPEPAFRYRLASGSHARRHSPLEAAEAAWQALPAKDLAQFGRLIATARGTFSSLAEAAPSATVFTALALTRQHADNLEAILAALRARLARLDQTLDDTRRSVSVLIHEIRKGEAAHAQTLQQLASTREAVEIARSEIRVLENTTIDLRNNNTHLKDQLSHRDVKIAQMKATFSWRATAPFRALRRILLDRRSKARARAAPRKPLPKLRASVDVPSVWDAAPGVGSITGWCYFEGEILATAVRAIIDQVESAGRYGQRRPDVVAAHKLTKPDSVAIGFQIPYRLTVDADHVVILEAQAPDGRWARFAERALHTSSFPRAVHDYTAWVEAFGSVTPERATALRARLAALPPERRPLLSVLMPVYNCPERWLVRAIESVRAQIYEQWELCIADDASSEPHVRTVLERFAAEDPRIRVTFRAENGHISKASNSALELVQGEFIVLLDHDDELPPDALAEVALEVAAHPKADVIYSDEDKIDHEGRRYNPYFKPDFLPDLLVGQNCLSHLSVMRTSLVREVGGFRAGFEGSQDWDLALRVVDRSSPERVRHIPKILYHWRAIAGSTAIEVTEKNYSLDSARRAVLEHFQRRGVPAEVHPVPGSHWRVVYPLREPRPAVTIIIPSRNAARLLRMGTESIFAHTAYEPYDLLIVNNRTDEMDALLLLEQLAGRPNVRVIDYSAPFNFSAIVNLGVKEARGEVVCLLNNDIEVTRDNWLTEMVSHAMRPEIGAVGAMLYYPDRTVQHAGVVLGLGGVANHAFGHHAFGTDGYMNRARLAQNYSAVTAACLVIRRSIYNQVGGFNETDLPVAFNDIDFCLRVRAAGFRNLWTPFAELIHHESASRGHENTPEKQIRFEREVAYMRRRWGEQLDHDPAYNVNLALSMEGWDLAWPPRV